MTDTIRPVLPAITFGDYSGFRINGKIDMPEPDDFQSSHLARASWLTAQVESGGKFGTVINYDGTGITAGIHQAIAVYPRALADNNAMNDQGPLWQLLSYLEEAWDRMAEDPTTVRRAQVSFVDFRSFLFNNGINFKNGKAFSTKSPVRLSGEALRFFLSGNESGIMPPRGPNRVRAEDMAVMFNRLFSSEWTFAPQLKFGSDHFVSQAKRKASFCTGHAKNETVEQLAYPTDSILGDLPLDSAIDLAMCVYWSYSVNAPGHALKMFCKACNTPNTALNTTFAKKLIQALGTTSFGRWDDDIPGGRYQRTRSYAMKKWPGHLFEGGNAIMPKDLVG